MINQMSDVDKNAINMTDNELEEEMTRARKRLKTVKDERDRRTRCSLSDTHILSLPIINRPEYERSERVWKRDLVWKSFNQMHKDVLENLRQQSWYKYQCAYNTIHMRAYKGEYRMWFKSKHPDRLYADPETAKFLNDYRKFMEDAYFEYLRRQPYDLIHRYWEVDLTWGTSSRDFELVKKNNGDICLFSNSPIVVSPRNVIELVDEVTELPPELRGIIKQYLDSSQSNVPMCVGRVLYWRR